MPAGAQTAHAGVRQGMILVRRYGCFFAAVNHVESEFEAIRSAELIEDSKKIISYGVFAEIELSGNIFVREAFGDEISQFRFAFCKQI